VARHHLKRTKNRKRISVRKGYEKQRIWLTAIFLWAAHWWEGCHVL